MNSSETIKNLADALAKAQGELKNPRFDSVNPHFKSKFASLAAVRDAVIPAFSKHGISVSQWPIGSDGHAGCKTILAHASGEWIHESFIIPVDKPNAHGYASAVTYAKRISLQSIAGVVGDEDDDGNAAVTVEEKAKPAPDKVGADLLRGAKTLDELADLWRSLKPDQRSTLGGVKDERKAAILKAAEATQA